MNFRYLSFLTLLLIISTSYIANAQNFTIAAADSLEVCSGDAVSDTINIGSILGYTDSVSLSISGLPAGATHDFLSNPVAPDDSTVLIINSDTAAAGTYPVILTSISPTDTIIDTIALTIYPTIQSVTVTLLSPVSPPTTILAPPIPLSWTTSGTGLVFNVYVATDPLFTNIVDSTIGLTVMVDSVLGDTSAGAYQPVPGIDYYWAIEAIDTNAFDTTNPCNPYYPGNGLGSGGGGITYGLFEVADCSTFSATSMTSGYGVEYHSNITGTSCISAAEIEVSGGTTPYSYSYTHDNGSSTGMTTDFISINDVGSGTVSLTDTFGCKTSTPYTFESLFFSEISSYTDPSCMGGCDGILIISNPGSSTGNLTDELYYIDEDGVSTLVGTGLGTYTGLCSGTYELSSSDTSGAGCVHTQEVILAGPQVLTNVLTSTDVTCVGNDGSATMNTIGGTAPYTYTWSTSETTHELTGVAPDTYIITVSDTDGCTNIDTAIIADSCICNMVVSTTISDASCFGDCDGIVSVNTSGATFPVSYAWSNGQSNSTVPELCAGSYDITITDAIGCTLVETVSVLEPPLLEANATASSDYNGAEISCYNACDGEASATATGGTSPYTYNWGNGVNNAVNIGLCAGIHTLNVVDSNGCQANTFVNLSSPTLLNGTISTVDATCVGNNGEAVVDGVGGTSPYTYDWSGGQSGDSVTTLDVGTHQLTITDVNGCTHIQNVTIGLDDNLAVTIALLVQNPSCSDATDGSAQVVASGSSSINYLWDNGETTAMATMLSAGSHTVTITDGLCTEIRQITLTAPAPVQADINSNAQTCLANNGNVSVSASGGQSPYTYNWSNGSAMQVVDSLGVGTHTVTVTDANGCTASDDISLVDQNSIQITATGTSPICPGDATGALDITVSPSGNYAYIWNNGDTTEDLSNVHQGVYSVTIVDLALGCHYNFTDTIEGVPALVLSTSVTPPATSTSHDGSISTGVYGGTPPYSFNWSNGSTNGTLLGIRAGTYGVTVTDANGCVVTDNINLQPASPISSSTDINLIQEIKTIPNPNQGNFSLSIQLASSQELSIKVMNVLSETILIKQAAGEQLSVPFQLGHLPNGTYLIQIWNEEFLQTEKIIISK